MLSNIISREITFRVSPSPQISTQWSLFTEKKCAIVRLLLFSTFITKLAVREDLHMSDLKGLLKCPIYSIER